MSENESDRGKNIEKLVIKNLKNNFLSPEAIKSKKKRYYLLLFFL